MSSARSCANCSNQFEIFPEDNAYYERIDVPWPTWCPACRHLRRHGHINDYIYFSRSCDNCQKRFVSIFPPHATYRVFCQSCWYAEERNDKAEGMDYDFSRPFFEQFDELMHRAPQLGIIGMNNQNSEYSESVANCKNVYLISESSNCEDCSYCYWIQKTLDCLDCGYLHECESCYEVTDSVNCYNLKYSQNCSTCSDSLFLDNCKSCSHCAFCTNLRQAKFCFFNQQLSEAAFQQKLQELELGNPKAVQELRQQFLEFLRTQPRKRLQLENTENCSGDYIWNAKNCRHVYHCYEAEDCAYGEHVWRGAKDCMDANTAGRDAELVYESTNSGIGTFNVRFCRYCWGCSNTEYCNQCKNGDQLFGCVGLKPGAKNCILNKQYSEADYHALSARIRQQMKDAGEYGEFFPLSISLFGYNTSVSFDEYPCTRDEALAKGWKWEQEPPGVYEQGTLSVSELLELWQRDRHHVLQETLTCQSCARNYRIVAHELAFYQKQQLPPPLECPDCRQSKRLQRRNPKRVFQASCFSCKGTVETALNPDQFEKIACDSCYEKLVYGS